MRDFTLDAVMTERLGPLPQWLFQAANHFVAFDQTATRLGFSTLQFDRGQCAFRASAFRRAADGVRLSAICRRTSPLALVTASATTVSLAAVLGEDVVQGMSWEPPSPQSRVWVVRGFIAIVAICGAALSIAAPTDPLRLVLWALSITGASLFPVMVLSIWWKRLTVGGATIGNISGFIAAAFAILMSEMGAVSIPSPIAGILGLPVSFALALGHEPDAARGQPSRTRDRTRHPRFQAAKSSMIARCNACSSENMLAHNPSCPRWENIIWGSTRPGKLKGLHDCS